jgi:protein TonB
LRAAADVNPHVPVRQQQIAQSVSNDMRPAVFRPAVRASNKRRPRVGPALLVATLHLLALLAFLSAGYSSLTSVSSGRAGVSEGIVNVSIPQTPKLEPSRAQAPPHHEPPPHAKAVSGTSPDSTTSANGAVSGSDLSGASAPTEPSTPGGAIPSDVADAFERELLEHIEPYRRYPSDAMGASGTVELMFAMDREGVITGVWIRQSSGSAALDREAVATVLRAQPLPHIPPELPDPLNITLPVSFSPAR